MTPVNPPNPADTAASPTADSPRSAASVDVVRRIKPPVDPSTLLHRQLRDDAFWQAIPPFAQVSRDEFSDFRWQMKTSVNSERKLLELLDGWVDNAFLDDVRKALHVAPMAMRVTPYILSLIDWSRPWDDPVRRQFIPVASSLRDDHPMLRLDSLEELVDSPVQGLTHRYVDKALFLALDTCPVYCRYCTRSYAIGVDTDTVEKVAMKVDPSRWEQMFDYIESRPELEDIVVSGGDAFNLAAKHIEAIGTRLLNMPNIRRIRYATKGPAVMPMKLLTDHAWLDALTRVHDLGRSMHKAVVVHTHFGHPAEITSFTRDAINRLFERGITVRNQSVLQRGVNDTVETMQLLVKRMGEVNVEPYYIYQCDMVKGVEDLRTALHEAVELAKHVRGLTAGFNTPRFVIDAPGGGGKREVYSYEHYDRETGVSVFRAPSVRPGDYFFYFDPLHTLSPDVQERWKRPEEAQKMVDVALEVARNRPR